AAPRGRSRGGAFAHARRRGARGGPAGLRRRGAAQGGGGHGAAQPAGEVRLRAAPLRGIDDGGDRRRARRREERRQAHGLPGRAQAARGPRAAGGVVKHLTEEELILLRYGEAESPAALAAHLAECGACREAEAALGATLAAVDGLAVPERGPGYEADVWARLEPRLEPRRGSRVVSFPARRGWVALLASAAALVAAFEAGRHWPAIAPAPEPRAASA